MKSGIYGNGSFLGIMDLPERKKPCLVAEVGNKVTILGTLSSEEAAKTFEDVLHSISIGNKITQERPLNDNGIGDRRR